MSCRVFHSKRQFDIIWLRIWVRIYLIFFHIYSYTDVFFWVCLVSLFLVNPEKTRRHTHTLSRGCAVFFSEFKISQVNPHWLKCCSDVVFLCSQDDYRVCMDYNIIQRDSVPVCPVDASGVFTPEVTHFAGQYVKVWMLSSSSNII